MVAVRRFAQTWWLVMAADAIALGAFAVTSMVAARDGVGSGALIIGVPPLVVAIVASLALWMASRRKRRWILGLTIAICTAALLVAMVSFITALLAVTAPVCGLLIAASAIRLGAAEPGRISA